MLKQPIPLLLLPLALTLLTGCRSSTGGVAASNGFSQNYQDRVGGGISNALPYSGTTKIYYSTDIENDYRDLNRKGYLVIGRSLFTGPPARERDVTSQAERVGADLVLVSSDYWGNTRTAIPWPQYVSGHSSTAAAPKANAAPVRGQEYGYDAVFLRKRKPPKLGIVTTALSADTLQQVGRNTGVGVWVVGDDSPAAKAGILEGDVVLKIGGEAVMSQTDFYQKTDRFAGRKVDIEVWRNGQFKTIPVQLNPKP